MNRLSSCTYIGHCALVVLVVVCTTIDSRAQNRSDGRPNVILIMTDDQGYGDLGAHGNEFLQTRHLNQLYRESIRLTDYHVDPICSPTRAALMTGRYSTKTRVWHTIAGRSQLSRDEITMADVFSEAGYRTGIFGKWHLGDNYPFRPQDNGFWAVDIAAPGTYEVMLRQRPRGVENAIDGSAPRLRIGDTDMSREVPAGASAVTFELQLEAGPTCLQTWFVEGDDPLRAAYYACVRRMD